MAGVRNQALAGGGGMSHKYFDLSALADAAKSCSCIAHLHFNDQGNAVFSIGNENIGAVEFDSYDDAMTWATDWAKRSSGDHARQAAGALATEYQDVLLSADGQAAVVISLKPSSSDHAGCNPMGRNMNRKNFVPAHKNLGLARELVEHVFRNAEPLGSVNAAIYKLLDGGDEYELDPLPGSDLNAIRANLKMAVKLASEPVPSLTTGRDRFRRQARTAHERFELSLFARTALALLDTDKVWVKP
jgi:hypothetical protein